MHRRHGLTLIELIVAFGAIICLLAVGLTVIARQRASVATQDLPHAVESGDVALVELLLKTGADANYTSPDGDSLLHYLAQYPETATVRVVDHIRIAKLLIEHGARTNMTGLMGHTPLHCAAHSGFTKMALLLLGNGADTEAINQTGETPIFASVRHPEIFETLCDYGALVNVRNRSGYTPLHIAVRKGNTTSVKLLLSRRADVRIRGGTQNETPMDIAMKRWPGRARCAMLLKRHGAKVNVHAKVLLN